MYCPKCNIHVGDYVERCPLCDGIMEVDEQGRGSLKTLTIPGKDRGADESPNDEPLDLADKDLPGDNTLEESLSEDVFDHDEPRAEKTIFPVITELDQNQAEPEDGRKDSLSAAPEGEEEYVAADKEEQAGEQKIPSVQSRKKSNRLPLITCGSLLFSIILAVGAYFFFIPPKGTFEESEPARPKDKAGDILSEKIESPLPFSETKEPFVAEPTAAFDKTESPKPELQVEQILPGLKPSAKPAFSEAKKVIAQPSQGAVFSAPASKAQYVIHVGSFKVKDNAFGLKDRLAEKGYSALCQFVSIPGKGDWYRVRVGNYSSRQEAEQTAIKLQAEEKLPTIISKEK